ncbi:hypothetical protein Tco_0767460 [Tanacetum coccineum]
MLACDLWRDVNLCDQSLSSDEVKIFEENTMKMNRVGCEQLELSIDPATLLERKLRHMLTVPPSILRECCCCWWNVFQTVQAGLQNPMRCLVASVLMCQRLTSPEQYDDRQHLTGGQRTDYSQNLQVAIQRFCCLIDSAVHIRAFIAVLLMLLWPLYFTAAWYYASAYLCSFLLTLNPRLREIYLENF